MWVWEKMYIKTVNILRMTRTNGTSFIDSTRRKMERARFFFLSSSDILLLLLTETIIPGRGVFEPSCNWTRSRFVTYRSDAIFFSPCVGAKDVCFWLLRGGVETLMARARRLDNDSGSGWPSSLSNSRSTLDAVGGIGDRRRAMFSGVGMDRWGKPFAFS